MQYILHNTVMVQHLNTNDVVLFICGIGLIDLLNAHFLEKLQVYLNRLQIVL